MSAAKDERTPSVVTLSGPLNANVLPTIRSQFSTVSRRVILDLRSAHSIDSFVLREFIRLRNHIGPDIAIISEARSIVYQTPQVLGFAKVFRIIETLDDALRLWEDGNTKALLVHRSDAVLREGSEPR